MAPVEVVSASTLVEKIAGSLRDAIVSGELEPGERIRQDDFSERLGVSRTPLREALVSLESEGFVVSRPRAGFTVANLSAIEAEELSIMRLALEPFAIRVAAEAHDDSEVARVLELLELTAAPIDVSSGLDRAGQANKDLHFALYGMDARLVPNSISDAIRQHWVRYDRYRRIYWRGTERPNAKHIADHTAVVEAWRNRDADRAEREMAHHILEAMVRLLRRFNPDAELSPAMQSIAARYEFDLDSQGATDSDAYMEGTIK